MRARIVQTFSALARLPDTPGRIAAAFAFGVFLGFSPLIGLQTILGIGLAFILRLSRVAVILGTWVNLPWIVPIYYVFATEAGARLLGHTGAAGLAGKLGTFVSEASLSFKMLSDLVTLLRPVVWPFVLGTTVGGLLLAFVAYFVMLAVLQQFRSAEGGAEPVA